ncbi:hypothetical protein KC342_g58 [Hortaea werneckii]|nr:hypothetical protein KC342_g58 [Hortaea werneckii]
MEGTYSKGLSRKERGWTTRARVRVVPKVRFGTVGYLPYPTPLGSQLSCTSGRDKGAGGREVDGRQHKSRGRR